MQVNIALALRELFAADKFLDFLTTLLYTEITSVGPAAKL